MNPEKQRIAIAEACPGLFERNGRRFNAGWNLRWRASGASVDPLSDLNAMHAAWVACIKDNAELEDGFTVQLARACGLDHDDNFPNLSVFDIAVVSNATAAQRAEAFLKAKGLWKPNAV